MRNFQLPDQLADQISQLWNNIIGPEFQSPDQLADQITKFAIPYLQYLAILYLLILIIYTLYHLRLAYPGSYASISSAFILLVDFYKSHLLFLLGNYGSRFLNLFGICVPLYLVRLYCLNKLPRIKREYRLLGAVCQVCHDIKALQITDTDHQFLNYDNARLQLTEEEKNWVKKTEDIVSNAEASKDINLVPVQKLLNWMKPIIKLPVQTLLDNRREQIKTPEFVSIIKKQEKSKRKFSSLRREGMLIEDGGESASGELVIRNVTSIRHAIVGGIERYKVPGTPMRELVVPRKTFSDVMVDNFMDGMLNTIPHAIASIGNKVELKLLLLEAFLKDLEHVKLESAMEKAWVDEVKLFVQDQYNALQAYSLLNEHEAAERHTGPNSAPMTVVFLVFKVLSLPFRSIRKLISLKVESDRVANGLVELLELKNTYSIKIIRIDQQTNSFQNRVHSRDIGLDLEFIREQLNPQISPAAAKRECISLHKRLEDMHTNLKAIEGVSNFGSVCLEQIRKTTSELKKALENYIPRWEALNIAKLETSSIERQIQDMERFIAAYDSKARPKSSTGIDLEEDADKLVKKLTSGVHQCCVFSIVGMQGIGKTTLAKKVYHHREISNHFPDGHRIWVSMHQGSGEVNAILEDVANQILRGNGSQEPERQRENEYYIQRIQSSLQEDRYLVVLDNVSSKTVWDELKDAFPESRNRSRILLTARDRMWDSDDDASKEHINLRLRTREESWALFLDIAQFPSELSSQNELMGKAKEVVASCWGLPLSLLKLGFLVAGEAINDQLLSKATEQVKQCETLWPQRLQINLLPDDLKVLLPYFTLFAKNSEIPARRLTALWVAEGLVNPGDDQQKTPENIAEDCLSRLVQRNIIQPLKKNVDGKVKTCCLPDPICSVLLPPRPDQQQPGPLRCVLSTSSDRQRLAVAYHSNYRIVDNFEFNDSADIDNLPPNVQPNYNKELISLISFDIREGDKPGSDIGNFLRKGIKNGCFKKIKVLDLERVFRPRLPKTIDKLIELRYLGLRWTYLEEIPSTIGNLSNLQTLDLKHTYIRILPSTIAKLQKLRHLYLNETCRGKFVQQSNTKSMQDLQTLSGVFLDENSPLKDLLDKLKNLTKLELSLDLSLAEQKKLANRIAKLTNLRSLRLRSVSVMSEAEDLHLGNFSQLGSLSSLYLFGRLENASRFPDFPRGLTDLTLSASGLEDDTLPILEEFPNLRSLCLFAGSFTGRRMVCSEGGFPELLVLKIWKLDILKDWTIKEQAMQKLKELEIRSCPKLEFPDGLKHLQTLRKVKVRDMQKDFIDRLVEYAKLRQDPPSIINL